MRVLLINPPYTRFKGLVQRYFPIGLGYIAGTLKRAGHEVLVYNAENPALDEGIESWGLANRLVAFEHYQNRKRNDDDPIFQEIRRVIEMIKPDALGIGCMTVTYEISKRVMRIARQVNPGMPLVWGGPHPTELPESVIREDVADFVVAGEGELTAKELFDRLADGGRSFDDIAGLWHKKDGEPVKNGSRAFLPDLDDLPFPDHKAMLNLHHYSRALMADMAGDIVASRGCPHECTFCSVMNVWGRSVRWRTPENVVQEIQQTKRDFGTIEFHFWDDTFTIHRPRTVSVLRALIDQKVNITWTCLTRADRLDPELIDLMKEAGCYQVFLGLESGSDRQLELMKKKITTADGRKAAKLLNEKKMFWSALMMVGLPEETEEEIMQTWSYLAEIKPSEIVFSVFAPFPGTELYAHTKSLGLLDDLVDWSTVETKSPMNAFVTRIDKQRFQAIYKDLSAWADHWNVQQKPPLWGGAMMRRHVYRKHPVLFAKRVYLAVRRRAANRYLGKLQRLRPPTDLHSKPA
jgi:anaerobic magnesium-protoporphyrin IX monomethyl ester cyclase